MYNKEELNPRERIKQAIEQACDHIFSLEKNKLEKLIEEHKNNDIARTVIYSGAIEANLGLSDALDEWEPFFDYTQLITPVESERLLIPVISFEFEKIIPEFNSINYINTKIQFDSAFINTDDIVTAASEGWVTEPIPFKESNLTDYSYEFGDLETCPLAA